MKLRYKVAIAATAYFAAVGTIADAAIEPAPPPPPSPVVVQPLPEVRDVAFITVDRPHRPCKFEDSNWCVWDAQHRGNHRGRSFWAGRHGKVHFVSHRTAHRLLSR